MTVTKIDKRQVSFVPLINERTNIFSNFVTTLIIHPTINAYYSMAAHIEESPKHMKDNKHTIESLNMCVAGINCYYFEDLKNHFDEVINNVVNSFAESDLTFWQQNYPNLLPIVEKYRVKSEHINWIKTQLKQSLSSHYSLIHEMEKSMRMYDSRLSALNNKTNSMKAGFTGGMIGGAIGSVLLPGIGTVIGGAIGGALAGGTQEDQQVDECMTYVNEYIRKASRLQDNLKTGSKHIYLTCNTVSEKLTNLEKALYAELKANGEDADQIMLHYFQYDMKLMTDTLSSQIQLDENTFVTYNQMIEEVHGWLNEYDSMPKAA